MNGLSDPSEIPVPSEMTGTVVRPPCRDVDQSESPLVCGSKRDDIAILLGQTPRLNSEQKEALNKAKKYAMEQSMRLVMMKQTLAHQQQQAKSLQRHQALVLMCRVYVGSISFELKEDTIRQAFTPFGPIKSINMSWDPLTQKHKGFAFVEYEMPEAAQLALEQMNGVMIGGRNIKVGRPSNMPQAQTVIDEITEEANYYNRIYIASVHTDLSENDIKSVFEAFGKIRACLLTPATTAGKHKGYGFIEYDTNASAQEAIASMNLFDLGGQYLRVGKSITPPGSFYGPQQAPTQMPTAAAVAAAAATAKIQAMDAFTTSPITNLLSNVSSSPSVSTASAPVIPPVAIIPEPIVNSPEPQHTNGSETYHVPPIGIAHIPAPISTEIPQPPQVVSVTVPSPPRVQTESEAHREELEKKLIDDSEPQTLHQQETISIKGQSARQLVMQRLMRNAAQSKVVVLRNMVGVEDVDEHLEVEISEECARFGNIERVVIYKEQQSVTDENDVIVKIFVEFTDAQGAKTAQSNLDQRFFGGRQVKAEIYDQNMFDHQDLSG